MSSEPKFKPGHTVLYLHQEIIGSVRFGKVIDGFIVDSKPYRNNFLYKTLRYSPDDGRVLCAKDVPEKNIVSFPFRASADPAILTKDHFKRFVEGDPVKYSTTSIWDGPAQWVKGRCMGVFENARKHKDPAYSTEVDFLENGKPTSETKRVVMGYLQYDWTPPEFVKIT